MLELMNGLNGIRAAHQKREVVVLCNGRLYNGIVMRNR